MDEDRLSLRAELEHAEDQVRRWTTIRDYLLERVTAGNPARSTIAGIAEDVLAERGGRMRTPEILAAVQERGGQAKDTDSLYKALSRSDRFRLVGRGTWELS